MTSTMPLRALPHALRPVWIITALATLVIALKCFTDTQIPASNSEKLKMLQVAGRKDVSLGKILETNLAQYKTTLDAFDDNIRLQAVFVVLALLLIIRKNDKLHFLGNDIPLSWLHCLVPPVMIFLWLSFGFLLDDLIETRITGVRTILAIDLATPSPPRPVVVEDSFVDLGKALYHDSGFVDGWFVTFVDAPGSENNYSGISHNFSTNTAGFLVLGLGTLISAAHACMLAVSIVGCRRYLTTRSGWWLHWYYLVAGIPLAFLIASHIQFAYGGENRNWIQMYIAYVTCALLALLLWLAIKFDTLKYRASVMCLRRQCVVVGPGQGGLAALRELESPQLKGPLQLELIGDSLSTSFHVGYPPGMLWRVWRSWRASWLAGLEATTMQPRSVCERLGGRHPIVARHWGCVSAEVDDGGAQSLSNRLLNRSHFSHQVDEVLAGDFPDLLMIWIGHNNLDWVTSNPGDDPVRRAKDRDTFMTNYRAQLERLAARAKADNKRATVIVFGLINFSAYFAARDEAEAARRADANKYPSYDRSDELFRSMTPDYRSGMIKTASELNELLRALCDQIQGATPTHIRFVFSDVFSQVKISEAKYLSSADAWHPSREGHALLAEACHALIDRELTALRRDE